MNRSRHKGRFCKSSKAQWIKNVVQSNISRNKVMDPETINVTGRRLVDMELFKNELWCNSCQAALSLRHACSEIAHGLASVYKVKCTNCHHIFEVHTSSMETSLSSKQPTYTINSKIVAGAIESGIGNTHINKVLTAANAPPMSTTLFKRHERKVGHAMEEVAKGSCLENLKAERELTIEREGLRSTELE